MSLIIKFKRSYLIKANNYTPAGRVTSQDLSRRFGLATNPGIALGVSQKAVPAVDEDSLTLAYQAARPIIKNYQDKIGALYFGSESPPYAVKPAVTLLVGFLDLPADLFGANLEFACRAGLEAAIITANFVEVGKIRYGLAIGSDTAQAKPGDVLAITAAAGASAWLLGHKPEAGSLKLLAAASYISDTPDFWRHKENSYPNHGGRFTGQPAYFHHLETVYNNLCQQTGCQSQDFAKVAIHAPNLKFPLRLAKKLGFGPKQIEPLWVDNHGNPYTASVMIQTVIKSKTLKPKQKLLALSFGSGAGSLGLILEKV